MKSNRRRSLQRELRKNRGRRILSEWSAALSEACGIEISQDSFLSVENTEELKNRFAERLMRSNRITATRNWSKRDLDAMLGYFHDVCIDVRTMPVVLFSSIDDLVGAIRVPADSILRNPMAVWKVVEGDLSLATEDLQHGLCLEETFYTISGEYIPEGIFEIAAWGVFVTGRAGEF